jgi:1-acyl-sn-glycerol-3-phosphate acyltransferase
MGVMNRLAEGARTARCVAVLGPGLILYSAGAALAALAGAPRPFVDGFYFGFARLCLRVGATRLEVHGREQLSAGQAYVIVPNHESNWDPVALVAALAPHAVRFVIKRQIIAIPVFGHALRLTGNVRVERTNTTRDVERIRHKMAERPLDVSMLFYAEGTRSRDGAFHAFKKGAFATAIAYGLPVLPIGHAGCYAIWKPETLWIRQGGVQVEIGEPIPTEGLRLADRDDLRDRTREAVGKLRDRARARLRERGLDPGGID